MKTTRIHELVSDNLRKGGIDKFPSAALDWLVQAIETKLEADAIRRIHKFMTPALISKAVGHAYSKKALRVVEAPVAGPSAPRMGVPPLPPSSESR
jgi:hypothetical protein